jgi:AraC-like DNA-binding protein
MEEKIQRVTDFGSITGVTWEFDGIRMGHAVSDYKGSSRFETGRQNDVVRVHFGLKGDYIFHYKQLGKSFDLVGGHHNTMYSNGFDMVVENKTEIIETFGIQFPKETFIKFTQNANDLMKRFSENILAGRSAMLAEQWGTIDSSIQQVIQQVLHCSYSGDLKKLFLLSKSIELLVLSAEASYRTATAKQSFIRNKGDHEKIMAVRELINERISRPPNLSEIAREVGLNEYKLKRGFKETFNNTIFGYLTEQRLQLAHLYLRDTQKTAAEIATELGYATPQHFNNAFKKKFGITPFLVRKNP